jgi:RNA polymerase sigma-70 factor (ECF subfamily)
MLADFPTVAQAEQTNDILQRSMMALYRSLDTVRPQNIRAFMGLAAVQIRRCLIDLARHYHGRQFVSLDQNRYGSDEQSFSMNRADLVSDPTAGPSTLQEFTEFHEHVQSLSDEDREAFELIYYQGLSLQQAAQALGVSDRTVKRRWRAARLRLHQLLAKSPP